MTTVPGELDARFKELMRHKMKVDKTKIDKAVIFDLDGVIVNTDDFHYRAWKRIADEEGIYFDREINERLRGVGRMESLEIILERAEKGYAWKHKIEMATRKNTYYRAMIRELTSGDILPGVSEVLIYLKNKGVKMAVGSSSKNAPEILRQVGLDIIFDTVVDGNDIKKSKPAPEVFLLAAERLGVKPQDCLVVEDADAGVEAAKAGGMKVLAIGFAAKNPNADFSADSLSSSDLLSCFIK